MEDKEKWIFKASNEEQGYKILTENKVIKTDDFEERQWIATAFELEDAVEICEAHNKLVEGE